MKLPESQRRVDPDGSDLIAQDFDLQIYTSTILLRCSIILRPIWALIAKTRARCELDYADSNAPHAIVNTPTQAALFADQETVSSYVRSDG